MKIIDKYILRELVGPAFFGLFIFGSLWMTHILMRMVNLFVTKGVALWAVIQIFVYSTPTVIVACLPMAMLLAVLLALGRLHSDSELIVIRACGVSFKRILMPVALVGALVSAANFAFNEWVVPATTKRREDVFLNEIVLKKVLPKVSKDIFFKAGDQFKLFVRQYDPLTEKMMDVTVYQFLKNKYPRITEAREAMLGEDTWTFYDGRTCVFDAKGQVRNEVLFKTWSYPLEKRHADRIKKRHKSPKEMNMGELHAEILRQESKKLPTTRLRVELYFKSAFPFAAFFLILIGAPLAVASGRSGAGIGVGLSILIMFCYYIVLALGKAMGDAGYFHPFVAAWLPNGVMALVAWFLIRRTR